MVPDSQIRRTAMAALVALLLFGCGQSERRDERDIRAAARSEEVAETSTAIVFDLSPVEKKALEGRALEGDGEASFRLAEYYSLAGGDGDPNITDEHDRQEELRWLELAAEQGHPSGEFNFAVMLAKDDCPRARLIMTKIRDETAEPRRREGAASWLRDPRFAC